MNNPKQYQLGKTIWEWDRCDDYPLWFLSKSGGITGDTRILEETLIEMGAKEIITSELDIFLNEAIINKGFYHDGENYKIKKDKL